MLSVKAVVQRLNDLEQSLCGRRCSDTTLQQALQNTVYKTGISDILNSFWFHCRIDRIKIADEIKICKDLGRTSKTLVGSREKIKFTARSRTACNGGARVRKTGVDKSSNELGARNLYVGLGHAPGNV